MRNVVFINRDAEPGLYFPVSEGQPRFLVLPPSDDPADIIAFQLDDSRDRKAFTLMLLSEKSVGTGRLVSGPNISVPKPRLIRNTEDLVGAALIQRDGLSLCVRDARGNVGLFLMEMATSQTKKLSRDAGTLHPWCIIDDEEPEGPDAVLFDSHPHILEECAESQT